MQEQTPIEQIADGYPKVIDTFQGYVEIWLLLALSASFLVSVVRPR